MQIPSHARTHTHTHIQIQTQTHTHTHTHVVEYNLFSYYKDKALEADTHTHTNLYQSTHIMRTSKAGPAINR